MRNIKMLGVAAAVFMAASAPAFAQSTLTIEALDANQDGVVSAAEWTAAGQAESAFATADTNADGSISAEELSAYVASTSGQ